MAYDSEIHWPLDYHDLSSSAAICGATSILMTDDSSKVTCLDCDAMIEFGPIWWGEEPLEADLW